MTISKHLDPRPFLDVASAETTADEGDLKRNLSKAAHEAEVLGLPDVKEHIEAALVHVVEQHDGEDGA